VKHYETLDAHCWRPQRGKPAMGAVSPSPIGVSIDGAVTGSQLGVFNYA